MKETEAQNKKSTIMVVDDNEFNLKVAGDILEKKFSVLTANSGQRALDLLNDITPSLILLDFHMPEMDGRQTMKKIQENERWKKIPIIFLTADVDPETEQECFALGASDFIGKPFVPMVMLSRVSRTIELYELQNDLEAKLAEKTRLVEKVSLNSIMAIASTIDAKDTYTAGHSFRVAQCAEAIAEKLGWEEARRHNIHYIALLHDIGKIGVPDAILNKPAKLSDEEFSIIKKHPVIGNEILNDIYMVDNVAAGALYHHERYDGTGYPFGLSGEQIPLCARIIGIADAYDAMTSNRIYRSKMTDEVVINEFKKGRGKQFDPQLTDIFVDMLKSGFHVSHNMDSSRDLLDDGSELLDKILTEYTVSAQNQAAMDGLTGIHDRNYGETQITKLLAKGHKGALLMIDFDNFKHLNDTFGHIVGDTTLKLFAKTLMDNTAQEDVVCRFGGDEFVVFLNGATDQLSIAKKAGEIFDALSQKLSELNYEDATTISIGIAVAPTDGKTFEELCSKADKSLYYVKKNGKNHYAFFSDQNTDKKTTGTDTDLAHIRYMIENRMDMEKGVFNVDYSGFKQLYNYISRGVKRNGQSVQALLFTINSNRKQWNSSDYEEAMKVLELAAAASLRMVDIGTRYSSMQYMAILMDTDVINGKMVAERVAKEFYKIYADTFVTLSYDIQTIDLK